MKISEFAINEIAQTIMGVRSGKELVALFNEFGLRDIYNNQKGGLPKLEGREGTNTSRTNYTIDRLGKINNSQNLKNLIIRLANSNEGEGQENYIQNINKVVVQEGFKLERIGEIFEIIGAEEEEEVIEVEVTFEQIQAQILEILDSAKFSVWVAVAWFTNKELFQKLVELKNKGINVQVIIVDDQINAKNGVPIESEFESRRIPMKGYSENNKMHNKFCVIDLNTVINGSYNWSNAAEYNDENITVIRNRNIAEEFASTFIKLKTE